MAKKKSNWMRRFAVRAKLKSPVGIRLTGGETIALAEIYEKDVVEIRENQKEVDQAIIATRMDPSQAIAKSMAARSSALGTYKITKDPVKKREWARRLVVADATLHSIRDTKKRLDATQDRLRMIKGDMELQLMQTEARAAETRAYAEAGGQLRLAGEKLIDARTRAQNVKVEYKNLEITMEGVEKAIDRRTDQDLLDGANKIAGGMRKVDNASQK